MMSETTELNIFLNHENQSKSEIERLRNFNFAIKEENSRNFIAPISSDESGLGNLLNLKITSFLSKKKGISSESQSEETDSSSEEQMENPPCYASLANPSLDEDLTRISEDIGNELNFFLIKISVKDPLPRPTIIYRGALMYN